MEVLGFLGVTGEVIELEHRQFFLRGLGLARGTPAAGAAAEQQFPSALADGEVAAAGVMDHDLMQRLLHFFSAQHGQQAYAVLGGIGGQFSAKNAGAGGHDVGESDGLATLRAGLDLPGPAHDERHAMPSLEGVGFPAAPVDVEMNSGFVELRKVRLGRRAVVAGKNDDRVVSLAGVIQRLQNLSDGPVGFHEKIGVIADTRYALETFAGCNRCVRRGHWEIEEERLLLALAPAHVVRAALSVLEQHG